jgi:hypothetical protein
MFGSLREPLKLCFIRGSHCFSAKFPSKLEGRQRFWPLQFVRRIELDCPARDDMAANQIQTRQKKGSIHEKRFCPTHFCENTTHPLGNLTQPPPQKEYFLILFTYQTCQVPMAYVRFPKCPKGTPFYQRPYVPLALWSSWVVISTLSTFWIMSAGRTPACEHMAENKPRTISPAETDH